MKNALILDKPCWEENNFVDFVLFMEKCHIKWSSLYVGVLRKPDDGDRRKGKGRSVCLGERIYSIPCRASYFAEDDFEELDGLILLFQMILVQFTLLFVLGKTASATRN